MSAQRMSESWRGVAQLRPTQTSAGLPQIVFEIHEERPFGWVALARGYCDTHYRRVRKWGDPTVVLRPWGTDHLQGSS